MKSLLPKLLFFYSTVVALLITVSSGRFVFLFLPVLTYFLLETTRRFFFSQDQILSVGIEKILIYYSFVISSLVVVMGFVSAGSLTQMISGVIFVPLLIYFASQVFPRRTRAVRLPKTPEIIIQTNEDKVDEKTIKLKKEGVDIDRRTFLKLIGSAGLSLFLFSIFTKRAEAAFFGSVPGPGTVSVKDIAGNKINPAEKQPTDGYRISRLDDASPAYYGFTNKDGAWFVMKELEDGSYLYRKGNSGFAAAWAERGNIGITYDEFENVF